MILEAICKSIKLSTLSFSVRFLSKAFSELDTFYLTLQLKLYILIYVWVGAVGSGTLILVRYKMFLPAFPFIGFLTSAKYFL